MDAEMVRTIIGAILGAVVGFLLESIPKLFRRISLANAAKESGTKQTIGDFSNANLKNMQGKIIISGNKQINKSKVVMKSRSVVAVMLIFSLVFVAFFWLTGSGGTPNGTYKPIGDNLTGFDIIIDNHLFKMKMNWTGVSLPAFYTYRNGEFKIFGIDPAIGLPYTYDEQTGHIVQEADLGFSYAKIEWARE